MGKVRGVHETTPEVRNRMVGMYEAGLGLREIAAALNCSQKTVKRWLNRFDKEGTVETRDRCGRKRVTTHEQDEAIVRLATQVPIKSAKAVLPALGLDCSVDTVRDRLHRAGFHNWNPPKKQIQKISLKETDGVKIEETVWRTTGTKKLGKKKLAKEMSKVKTNQTQRKKKLISEKNKSEEIVETNPEVQTPNNVSTNNEQQHNEQPNFSFSSSLQNDQPHPDDLSQFRFAPVNSLPNYPLIGYNQNEYVHSLNLIPQNQPTYHHHHHHPGQNISQNWPLDSLQISHYLPNQPNLMHHEANAMNIHQEFHNHHQTSFTQHLQDQINSSIHINQLPQEKISSLSTSEQHQEISELSPEKLSESQDDIINVCSDVCSDSSFNENENSQNSINDNVSKRTRSNTNKQNNASSEQARKKGGKIKGTLETSVEIRNHMIGMSQAGLSTLSIALSINRSERTVKRWLDRWRKEGNVLTKERKGRKRITTKEEDEAIVALASQQPLTAAKNVAPALGLKCSVDTVRERLHEAGFHSWKLGKKQGKGNAVHSVVIWQPSGNRSLKIKKNIKKKIRSNKKKKKSSNLISLKVKEKQVEQTLPEKISEPVVESILKEPPTNYHNQLSDNPVSAVETSYSMSQPPVLPLHPPHSIQNLQISSICSQQTPMQMHQRPDCRLALPTTYPQIPTQASVNIPSYPSCMMGNTNHIGHMEQTDPVNFEPYVWSF